MARLVGAVQSRCKACAAPIRYGKTTCPSCDSDVALTGASTLDFRRDGQTILKRLGLRPRVDDDGNLYYADAVAEHFIYPSGDILNVLCVGHFFDLPKRRSVDQLASLCRELNIEFPAVTFVFLSTQTQGLYAIYESLVETESEFVVFVRCAAEFLAVARTTFDENVNAG